LILEHGERLVTSENGARLEVIYYSVKEVLGKLRTEKILRHNVSP